jgi:LPXTG-motif cell wall-anchored protein
MIRRMIGAAVAATALVLVPTGSFGYEGDAEVLVVTDGNPEPGEPFEVIVEAGPESDEATLTVTSQDPDVSDDAIDIAGTQSMTKATNAAGAATFTVTLYVEGRYVLQGFDEDGNLVGESMVVVGDGEPGSEDGNAEGGDAEGGDEATGGGGTSAGGGVTLPDTGSSTGTMLLGGAGALLLAGGVALLYTRRRNTQLS